MSESNPIEILVEISQSDTDIVVSYPGGVGVAEFLNEPPNGDFVEALNYFCQKFYSNVPIEKRPWHIHRSLTTVIPELEAKKKRLEASTDLDIDGKERLRLGESIKSLKASTEAVMETLSCWPLAWYWKTLFGAFPKLLSRGRFRSNEVTVRISQVRQWTLVVVYETIGNTKQLLRPPLFGLGERVTNFDLYLTLLRFSDPIANKWNRIQTEASLGNIEDCQLDEELAYIIGRHDLLYRFKPSDDITDVDSRISFKVNVSIDLDPHIKKYDPEDISGKPKRKLLKSIIENKIVQEKIYPYDVVSMPTFDQSSKKEEEILLASDHVCQAYEELSEIWNDKTTKSVLIIAPPGSGKEILSRSIHQFQYFGAGPLVSFALSPCSDELNYRMLYSVNLADAKLALPKSLATASGRDGVLDKWIKQVESVIRNGSETPSIIYFPVYEGLLFKARKGVLFLDEIDKVSEQSRASLLRVLENGEFAIYDSSLIVRFKEWKPLYVLAGSMPKEEMFSLRPADFWTRISHTVEMGHPLSMDDELEAKRVARDYFCFFWQKRLMRFFVRSGLLPFEYDNTKSNQKDFFENYYVDLFRLLSSRLVVRSLSSLFAESLSEGGRLDTYSIRNIRAVAGRVRYGLVDYLLYNKRTHSALARIRVKITKDGGAKTTSGDASRWFAALGLIIGGQDIIEGLSSSDCEGLRSEVRSIISSAIRRS